MKQFKCGNCGSSQYLKVEEDVCVCEYCGAKFKVEKTVKDVFLKDLKAETSVSNNKCAKFMEATFNEEDFRKKVLMHLSLNKHTPSDILDSKFGYVNYRYVYFAIFDVVYYSQNYYANNNNGSFSPTKEKTKVHEQNMCIKITKDCNAEQSALVLGNYQNLYDECEYRGAQLKDINVDYPKQNEVNELIEKHIANNKEMVKGSWEYVKTKKSKFNELVHEIENLKILAVPEYYIEFNYKGKDYKLSSFANEFNLYGEIPQTKEFSKTLDKKLKWFCIPCIIIAVLISGVAIYLNSVKTIQVAVISFMLFVGALVVLVALVGINAILTKKLNDIFYKDKRKRFVDYAKQNNIFITGLDDKYMKLLRGGY